MPIDFHNHENEQSYATRNADGNWIEMIGNIVDIEKVQHAADIGCGGGIYSKALADMGIPKVTGVDFSESMIHAARLNCNDYSQIQLQVGNAYDTGLPNHAFELVLERALIHHLDNLPACLHEANRIMKKGGTFIIQDRTPEDCLLEGTTNHIRGYFLSLFPRLKEIETRRRYSSEKVSHEVQAAGFTKIEEMKLWEIRKCYPSKADLLDDIRLRTGRSILHDLNNNEIEKLVKHIDSQLSGMENIIEKDRWTIWKAVKE